MAGLFSGMPEGMRREFSILSYGRRTVETRRGFLWSEFLPDAIQLPVAADEEVSVGGRDGAADFLLLP